ncbi:DUF4249 family protein [Sungkyunkwania multivorans]|uniref:DUF4249 family protein n=1 Tax=Sungkyunkwania multivorans TaxID=1173618 RepID=A0ABW3CZP1_9FLAO
MKKLVYIILFGLLLSACEDVIDVDVSNSEPRLVIDALLVRPLNDNGFLNSNYNIKLSLSSPFFAEEIPPATGATVFITAEDGTEYAYQDDDNDGDYNPVNPFSLEFDIDYTLTVIYDGETYTATERLMPTVPIDNLEQGDGVLFGGDETEVKVTFTDEATRNDYYLFDLGFDLFLPSEDEFYNGSEFTFSYFYEDMLEGEEVNIRILGITEQFYNYMNILLVQADQDGGGPFQSPAATVRGNIANNTDSDNFPLGYFSISEVDDASITIQ